MKRQSRRRNKEAKRRCAAARRRAADEAPPSPPSALAAPAPRLAATVPGHPWLLVLGLIGVDYFSTLAYLPTIACASAGPWAPWAALLVVLITLLLAMPIYSYVLGRSPHGQGASGLLERTLPGWRGKFLALLLLGFVAEDFVVPRSISTADAAVHVNHNPYWSAFVDLHMPSAESMRAALGPVLGSWLAPFWNPQVGVTLALLALAVVFWLMLARGFTRSVLWLAAGVTAAYLLMNAALLGSLLWGLARQPAVLAQWWDSFSALPHRGAAHLEWRGFGLSLLALLLFSFPRMALGISACELTISLMPLVRGAPDDDPEEPRLRIVRTRRLLLVAALIMGVFLCAATLMATLLVPEAADEGSPAAHRALSYLAHGGQLGDRPSIGAYCPFAGPVFGTLYDLATVAILCLSGVGVMIGLRDLAPRFLCRLGMDESWASRFGIMIQVFNLAIVVVAVVFKAEVKAQEWAYSTTVQALLCGTAAAAFADLHRRAGGWRRWPLHQALALAATLFFLATTAVTLWRNWTGLAMALGFIAALLTIAKAARWLASL